MIYIVDDCIDFQSNVIFIIHSSFDLHHQVILIKQETLMLKQNIQIGKSLRGVIILYYTIIILYDFNISKNDINQNHKDVFATTKINFIFIQLKLLK